MFLEIILAGLVAYSAHNSAYNATAKATRQLTGTINASTAHLDRSIARVESKLDQLHYQINEDYLRLMQSLNWHDYIQTLHIKGAKYKGNEQYVFREKNTITTANLATKEVKEVNGSFTLYKSFVDDTEKLYAQDYLVYEKFSNGEINVYDDNGRVYMHTNLEKDTYTYRPDGKTQSIRWHDGSVWLYHYDKHGNPVQVESFNMKPTSKRPMQPNDELALKKWKKCKDKHAVGACINKCREEHPDTFFFIGRIDHTNACLQECQSIQYAACGPKPNVPM